MPGVRQNIGSIDHILLGGQSSLITVITGHDNKVRGIGKNIVHLIGRFLEVNHELVSSAGRHGVRIRRYRELHESIDINVLRE